MASSARLDELKKKFDENPRRYFAPLANEHRKSGDLDQAIALCRTHLPQQPAHISGHIVLAQALFEAGSLDESREIFHTALGLDPENLIALRYLGDIAREASDVSTARSWYQRVLEVDPRNDEIVQLVRDLDNPPSAPVEAPDALVTETADNATGGIEPAEADAAPATDERFAPLSLESVDFDAAIGQDPASAQASEQTSAETIDVDASWNAHPATTELPMLDAPDMDPFDLNPASSAESLYDADSDAPVEDIFMTELAALSAPDAGHIEPEYSLGDAWAPTPEPETVEPEAAIEPEAATAASADFDEGSFYLEPAPNASEPDVEQPVAGQSTNEAPVVESVEAASAQPAALESVPSIDEFEPMVEDGGVPVNAHAFADAPTAEWQTPTQSQPVVEDTTSNDLGLEVMEFVPPASERDSDQAQFGSDAVQDDEASQAAAPAAFVTETMAELYLQQGFRNEALAVYRELLARNPSDGSLRDRIDQIESGSMSSLGVAAVSEEVVESALRRQSAKPARSVRSFFAALASRRAPHQPGPDADAHVDDVSALAPDESAATDPYVAPVVEEATPEVAPAEPQHGSPTMSAAETLASYDPFADAMVATPEAVDSLPNVEPPALHVPTAPEPAAETPREIDPPRSSLEALFPDTPIPPRAEIAAQTLATAFGRPEPQGRPTRAASSELSLDKVFRGSADNSAPTDGGFSFDQFFSDSRPAGSDIAAPTMSLPETGRSGGGAGDAHDIEQFTAWLEGLKKK